MMRKLVALALVFIMAFSLAVPVFAAPERNGASREALEKMVRGYVEANYDSSGMIGKAEGYITGLVTDAVKGALSDKNAMISLASPLLGDELNALIKKMLQSNGQSASDADVSAVLDALFDSGVIKDILSIEAVADILDRTVEYAVADALAKYFGIGGGAADATLKKLVQKYTDEIAGWNYVPVGIVDLRLLVGYTSDFVNPFHKVKVTGTVLGGYKYSITGWQNDVNYSLTSKYVPALGQYKTMESYIKASLLIDSSINAGENLLHFDKDEFMSNLPNLILAAAKRAALDVAAEKADALKAQIRGVIEAEMQKRKDKAVKTIRDCLAGELIKTLPVTISAKDTIQDVKAKMEAAIGCYNATKEQIEDTIAKLQVLKAKIEALPSCQYKSDVCALLSGMIDKCREKHSQCGDPCK